MRGHPAGTAGTPSARVRMVSADNFTFGTLRAIRAIKDGGVRAGLRCQSHDRLIGIKDHSVGQDLAKREKKDLMSGHPVLPLAVVRWAEGPC